MGTERSSTRWVWPDVSTRQGVADAAFVAGAMALVRALVVAAFALLPSSVAPVQGTTPWPFLDAALFLVIAIGIWKRSRTAAVAGLVLVLVEAAFDLFTPLSTFLRVAPLFVLAFVNAVRGTFSHAHMVRKAALMGGEDDPFL